VDTGTLEDRYEYDAFGQPYKGDLGGGMNLGYTGKPYDTATGLYNYGYRDYRPQAARFTTVDPIRDGSNWFAYVRNDPVNWVDLWGLFTEGLTPTSSWNTANKSSTKNNEKAGPSNTGNITAAPTTTATYSWPVTSGTITSVYGDRDPPTPNSGTFHYGLDIAGDKGQPVTSIGSGTVSTVGNNDTFGNYVVVTHQNGDTSQYSHLDTSVVSQWQPVITGSTIGTMGNTGESTGVHVDLRIKDPQGNYVDPITVLTPKPSAIGIDDKSVVVDPKTGTYSNIRTKVRKTD